MSYLFNGSNDELVTNSFGSTLLSASVIEFGCWFNLASFTDTDPILFGDVLSGLYIQSATSKPSCYDDLSGFDEVVSSGSVSTGTWYYLSGVLDKTNGRKKIYFNGNTDTSTSGAGSHIISQLSAGVAGGTEHFHGNIAECFVYSEELSTADRAMLQAGWSPRHVRPSKLLFYAPLRGSLQDLIYGNSFAVNSGSPTAATHPRIYP